MGNVYDRNGKQVGSVNAWGGNIYDTSGKKVGDVNIFNSIVTDCWNFVVGKAFADGDVFGVAGRLICRVPFFGTKVYDFNGKYIGDVEVAGAPDPMPDIQCRGAAALLLLCDDLQKEAVQKAKDDWDKSQKARARKWAEEQRQKLMKKGR